MYDYNTSCSNDKGMYSFSSIAHTQSHSHLQISRCKVVKESERQCEKEVRLRMCVYHGWLRGVTCCVHMDGAHAGPVYTPHMEPVEENLLDCTSETGKSRLGPWEQRMRDACVGGFVLLYGANRDQPVAFK